MPVKEEHRPLFTIAVLVSGVVGGLAVVIAVVYLYRFCLKKRPPVTTTVLPEAKREQIRSNAISQSRPLPLPLYADTNTPLISYSSTKEYMKETAVEEESVLGSPTRIAKVFPLIRKEQAVPYIQRSAQDLSQNKSFLSVSGGPLRARSVDVLETDPNSETRRASFDVQRGTGRQLPSTEGLEKQFEDRSRRVSTLSRSDAIQSYQPVKQNSNPLPEHPRIYERNHVHSRSWNVESEAPPSKQQQNDYEYYQMDEFYPMDRQYIPTISEPQVHLGVKQFQRQAKSCDERNGGRDSKRLPSDQRLTLDVEQSVIRHNTTQHLQPETPIAAACQSLWAAKGHLEELHALGISDPSSASTSFESNTDNSATAGSAENKARVDSANKKRLQYKSLLLRRKFLSTAAVSSLDSTNSTESSAPDAMFVSSVDSGGSDLEHRRLSLMNRISTGSVPHIMSRPLPWINEPTSLQQRRQRNDRDYSVDEHSDSLFREWSRVDPAYEDRAVSVQRYPRRQLVRGMSESQSPLRGDRQHMHTRQYSVNSRTSNVVVPLIRYPDEANCSR